MRLKAIILFHTMAGGVSPLLYALGMPEVREQIKEKIDNITMTYPRLGKNKTAPQNSYTVQNLDNNAQTRDNSIVTNQSINDMTSPTTSVTYQRDNKVCPILIGHNQN